MLTQHNVGVNTVVVDADYTIDNPDSDAINSGGFSASNTDRKYRDGTESGGHSDNGAINLGGWDLVLREGLRVYHLGVDWLTLSATNTRGQGQLENLFADMIARLVADGDMPKEGKWLQYQGHAVGRHLFYGVSRDGVVLRASAHAADDLMYLLRKIPAYYFRPTRVDLQLTAISPVDLHRGLFRELSDLSYAAAQAHAQQKRRGRPWHVSLRDEYGRGDTVYLGDRRSESYQRIYDKHFESRNRGEGSYPPRTLRFEVEQKGSQAERQLLRLRRVDDLPGYIGGYVRGVFEARGIAIPVDVAPEELIRTAPRDTDVERTLRWAEQSVRPVVQRLLSMGYGRELCAALGLRELR